MRPWLYRIARNRCLNHLRRVQPIGVDSMDVHLSEHGASTADKVYARERFRLLVDDIHRLPETQRSALVLREMDALSYEQIAEAMETTVPGVKSLLVRARISLAEAAEARQLGCPDVRIELAEVAEGSVRRPRPLVRRHLRTCGRCATFQRQLKHTNKSLGVALPVGWLASCASSPLLHIGLGHSAGAGSGATGSVGAGGATAGASGAGVGGATAGAGGATAGVTGATAGAAGRPPGSVARPPEPRPPPARPQRAQPPPASAERARPRRRAGLPPSAAVLRPRAQRVSRSAPGQRVWPAEPPPRPPERAVC